MNNKTLPNQMRILLGRMRGKSSDVVTESKEDKKKELSVREMLKITRTLNEDTEDDKKRVNKKSVYDQQREEERFMNFFENMNVNVKFIELEIYDDLVFWGGTIDDVIQFVFIVTPERKDIQFNLLKSTLSNTPENEKIVEKIKEYFDGFYRYWRDNIFQKQ